MNLKTYLNNPEFREKALKLENLHNKENEYLDRKEELSNEIAVLNNKLDNSEERINRQKDIYEKKYSEYNFLKLYFEEELSLVGGIHRYSRQYGFAALVVDEGPGEAVAELLGNRSAFDYLLEAAGIDVVLHLHALTASVVVDELEPFAHTFEKDHILAEFAK